MSCQHSQPGSGISCSACQLQSLQNQNNQSWQYAGQTFNSFPLQNQIPANVGTLSIAPYAPTTSKSWSIEAFIENNIITTIESVSDSFLQAKKEEYIRYCALIKEAASHLQMSNKEYIQLKFFDNKSDEEIKNIIKDKLDKILKMKVML